MDTLIHNLPDKSEGIQIGIDIGQRRDPTAIVVVEKERRGRMYHVPTYDYERRPPTEGHLHYVVRHMERLPLGTTYPEVAKRLAQIYNKLPRKEIDGCYIDATGVGKPVADEMKEEGVDVIPVYITAGRAVTETHGEIHLAKEQMISRLQALSQRERIHLPPDHAEAQVMARELLDFEIRITDHAHAQFEAKVGSHDDYVTALGLATWEHDLGTIYIGDAPEALQDYFGGVSGRYW